MDAKLLLAALELAQTLSQFFVNFNSTASTDQIKALIAEAHAQGKTIDLAAVDAALADMRAAGVDLDAKIKAAQN